MRFAVFFSLRIRELHVRLPVFLKSNCFDLPETRVLEKRATRKSKKLFITAYNYTFQQIHKLSTSYGIFENTIFAHFFGKKRKKY